MRDLQRFEPPNLGMPRVCGLLDLAGLPGSTCMARMDRT